MVKSSIKYAGIPKENEKLPLQLLEQLLPGQDHIVIFGAHVPTQGMLDRELDVLLICPTGLFIIELKNWRGKIVTPMHMYQTTLIVEWNGGRRDKMDNPQRQASDQGRILRKQLDKQLALSTNNRFFLKEVIIPAVFFTVKKSELEFTVDEARSNVPVYTMDTIRQLWENRPLIYTSQEIQTIYKSFNIIEQKIEGHSFPKQIDNYAIEQLLFQRAHYSVYKAHDEFGRSVFLKAHKIDQKLLKEQEQVLNEITKRDGFVSVKLAHNSYVLLQTHRFSYGEYICSVTLWEDHHTLAQLMRDKLSIPEKMNILKQLFTALLSFHDLGIYHRDLHPQNILVTESGQLKCINFDFSRIVGMRTVAAGIGNADSMYSAPELRASEENVREVDIDHHTDYYSYGFIAYEFLSGKKAFESPSSSPPPPLMEVLPEIPEEMSVAVESMLNWKQSERETGWEILKDSWGL